MRLCRYFFVKKPRYEMKAVVSKMSPHNFLSCCLKFCMASAHLTFSEASPPTCRFKDQREKKTCHTAGYEETWIQSQRAHSTRLTAEDSECPCVAHLITEDLCWLQQSFQLASPCSVLCMCGLWTDDRL